MPSVIWHQGILHGIIKRLFLDDFPGDAGGQNLRYFRVFLLILLSFQEKSVEFSKNVEFFERILSFSYKNLEFF